MGSVRVVLVLRQLKQRRALGAECTAVDHMIRIALDIDGPATGFARMHDGAAAHRTVAADGGRGLLGILGLEHLGED